MGLRVKTGEVAEMCNGEFHGRGTGTVLRGVSIDSRGVRGGELFVAIRGEKHDGHDFLRQAARQGAAAMVVERRKLRRVPGGMPAILVKDTTTALGRLAAAWRQRCPAGVIAVTGSSGKTTTKELIRLALGGGRKLVVSERSYNNQYGVPLTLLRMGAGTAWAVVELGTNHRGEIAGLVGMSRPDIGLITNIGEAHIGHFGSRRAIAGEKAALVRMLPPAGRAVLNVDCPYSRRLVAGAPCPVLTFGENAAAMVRGDKIEERGRKGFSLVVRYRGGDYAVELKLIGRHNVGNALAAFAVAVAAGEAPATVARRLSRPLRNLSGRLQLVPWRGGHLIDDSYNANPDSVRAALVCLAGLQVRPGGQRVAVLGDMLELGGRSRSLHEGLGREVRRLKLDRLFTVGTDSYWIGKATGWPEGKWRHFEEVKGATAFLRREPALFGAILVKGSRLVGLERVVQELRAWQPKKRRA